MYSNNFYLSFISDTKLYSTTDTNEQGLYVMVAGRAADTGSSLTIGIIPGQPFHPDNNSKKILDEAAILGNLKQKILHTTHLLKNSSGFIILVKIGS
jgi:hypothetical protein